MSRLRRCRIVAPNPRSASWVQEYRLWLKRPTPLSRQASGVPLHLNPRPRFRALAPAASFRGSLCFASLSAKKYVTTYFSVLERTSRYPSRSCSFVAELLAVSLRKALALRCQCVERCRTLKFTGRKRSDRGSPLSSLSFVEGAGEDLRGRAAPLHDDS